MNQIKMFKPNNREILINDLEGAVEVMLKDGWRLDPFEKAPKNPVVETVEDAEEEATAPVTTSRRRRRTTSEE